MTENTLPKKNTKPENDQEESKVLIQLLNSAASPSKFFPILTTYIESSDNMSDSSSKMLVEMNTIHNIDVVSLFSKLRHGIDSLWILRKAFADALPMIRTSPTNLLQCIASLADRSRDEFKNEWVKPSLEKMALMQPLFAQKLIHELVNRPCECKEYLVNVLIGLSEKDIELALRLCREITRTDEIEVKRSAIISLGFLKYCDRPVGDVFEVLTSFVSEAEIRLSEVALSAIGELLVLSPDVMGVYLAIQLHVCSDQARNTFPKILYRNKVFAGRVWFKVILSNLAESVEIDIAYFGWIDFLLAELLGSEVGKVDAFLDRFLSIEREIEIATIFPDLIRRLASDRYARSLSWLIPKWLSRKDRHFWAIADAVLEGFAHRMQNQAPAVLWFSKRFLDSLEISEIHILIRKVIGYVFVYPKLMLSMILSCARRTQEKKITADMIVHYLVRYVGKNYYQSTTSFIDAVQMRGDQRICSIVGQVRARIDYYYDRLKTLPVLSEQRPSARRWAVYSRSKALSERKAMKEANKKSIARFISPEVPVKFGHRIVFQVPDSGEYKLSEPSEMKKIEVIYEYPRKAIMDPLGLDYDLMLFRYEAEVKT